MLTIEQVPSADYEQLQLMYGDWSGKVNFKINGKTIRAVMIPKPLRAPMTEPIR